MEKYKYADTAKINVKPDGSVVCSLYVNDSKEKKEYFKNAARMKKAAGSNGNSKKKRTVTVSKSTKAKHRDKLKVESYLQANSWEYVLRVPITSVDHQTTWTKFKQRYNYKHKDHPLQYVMVKGDGELYGVISNAPVEGENIPLVNVEHSVVSAFDNSMIKQMTALSLQYKYKGKEHSYVSSNGLKEKTFEFVNLGGIEYFSLPDNALVTQMQASLVFNGGTVEENLAAARRFIEEKKVEKITVDYYTYRLQSEIENMLKHNNFKGIAASVSGNIDDLEITEPVKKLYDGKERTIVEAKYKNQVVFRMANYETILDRHPMQYIIWNWKTGMIYYVGLAKEPLCRYCDHFGYNNYPEQLRDRFLKTAQKNGWNLQEDFRIAFIPSAGFIGDDNSFVKGEMFTSYNIDAPEDVQLMVSRDRKKHTDKFAEGDEAVLQWDFYANDEFRKKHLYIAENGLPLYWVDEAAKNNAERLAKARLEDWNGKSPIEEAMRQLAGENQLADKVFWPVKKVFFMMHCRNVMMGIYDIDSPVFHEIVKKQADFLRIQGFDIGSFIATVKKMVTQQ